MDAGDMDVEVDRQSIKLATASVKELNAKSTGMPPANAGGMTLFIQNLAKTDKAAYEQLVELMRFFNLIDVDLR